MFRVGSLISTSLFYPRVLTGKRQHQPAREGREAPLPKRGTSPQAARFAVTGKDPSVRHISWVLHVDAVYVKIRAEILGGARLASRRSFFAGFGPCRYSRWPPGPPIG